MIPVATAGAHVWDILGPVTVVRAFGLALGLAFGPLACVQPLNIEGRACPCATDRGFDCCSVTGLCVPADQAGAPGCRPRGDAATVTGDAPVAMVDAPAVEDAPTAVDANPGADLPPDVAADRSADTVDVPAVCPAGAGRARAVFFSTPEFTGQKREQPAQGLSFDWGENAPATGIGRDNWSALIRGQLQPEVSADYTFRVRADQGVDFWLAGQAQLALAYLPVGGRPVEFTLPLLEGRKYELVMQYAHKTGPAYLDVSWQRPGQPLTAIPACALYPDSLFSAACPDGDQPCRLNEPPPCPSLEGLGMQVQLFAAEDFTRPLFSDASVPIHLNWGILISEEPAVINTRAIRFQGKVRFPRPETHTFYLLADPAADIALTVDGHHRKLPADGSGVARELALDVPPSGKTEYPITLEYVMRVPPEQSFISLRWKSDSMMKRETSLCYLYNP